MKKRSDGRYRKTVKDETTGKTIYFYGMTEREVNRKMLDYERKKARGKTFAEVADAWWTEVYDTLAHQTLRSYKAAYKRILEEFGSELITDILPQDVSVFYRRLAGLSYSQKTMYNHRVLLNQIFNEAILQGEIDINPCAAAKMPKGCKKKIARTAATPEEEARIMASEHPWTFPIVALLTGLRKGEILALQWKDIDFEKNTINVYKSVEHIGKKPHIKAPKTDNGYRLVPLLDVLRDRLYPLKGDPEAYIYSEDGGKTPLSEHRYTRLYKDYCRDVGITSTAHQLRHSFATIAVEIDVNPKDLQNALGHADISTTMNIYAEAREKSAKKVANKFNEYYKGTGKP